MSGPDHGNDYYHHEFDAFLRTTLAQCCHRPDGSAPPLLAKSIEYSLLAPGKRIRARLLLNCAEMLDLPRTYALHPAAALEMIHCSSLIHDDLPCMDNDDFRRGQPSNHVKFGEATALLAGDALIALAVEVFLHGPIYDSPANQTLGLKRLVAALGPRGMIGGQAAELALGPSASVNELKAVHSQKTGALFSAALLIPKDLKGIPDESREGKAIHAFAYELGLAFQLADDLEDEQSEKKKMKDQQSPSSSNILYYVPRQEAVQCTLDNLLSSLQQLTDIWGKQAAPLNKIASEVTKRLAH